MSDSPYNLWNPSKFYLPGAGMVLELTAQSALKAGRGALKNDGTSCPCCGQHVQVYRRSVYARMAECLLWLVQEHYERGGEWVSLKSGPVFRGGDNTKLLYWKLIEKHPVTDDLYRPTQLGKDFAKRKVAIPKYAFVYNGEVQGFSDETVTIVDCCENFNFATIGLHNEGETHGKEKEEEKEAT